MYWNCDFAIVSMIINIILYCFYNRKKFLPLRRNRLFHAIIVTELVAAGVDIVSSVLCEFYRFVPEYLNELICTAFYIIYIQVIVFVFVHTRAFFNVDPKRKDGIYYIPAIVMIVLYLSNLYLHFIFSITKENGFAFKPAYNLSVYFSLFYAIVAIVSILRNADKISAEQKFGLLSAWVIIFIGVIYERVNPRLLITNLTVTIAELVLYLIQQNPDLYRDRFNEMYNYRGFEEIAIDLSGRGESFSGLCIEIQNYENMRSVYNGNTIESISSKISDYIVEQFKETDLKFYLSKGMYIILFSDEDEHRDEAAEIVKRFNTPWEIPCGLQEKYYIRVDVTAVYLPRQTWGKDYSQFRDMIFEIFTLFSDEEINKVHVMDDDKKRRIKRRYEVAQAIERALINKSVEVYYQPIYSYEKNKVISAEALARMHDDKLGFIPPDEFISIAEKNGKITELGYQIFEKICAFIRDHDLDKMGLDYIEINLSPIQFRNEKLAERLLEIIDKYKVDPRKLNFEITESAMTDIGRTLRQIEPLKERGISFSMDDYGTGYSNLIAIFKLPFSILKIDKSIVWSHFNRENDMLYDFIKVFRKNGLKVVCEGVETEEMVNELNDMECEFQQGYYYSRPVEESQFLNYIEKINGNRSSVR